MTKPKWYHYLLAASSQDPDNPTARMHSPSEEASAYANKDEDKLRKIHEDQIEFEKKVAPIKATTAMAALSIPATAASVATYGWFPTIATEILGGLGSYGLGWLGKKGDEKFDTKFMEPTGSILGGLFGGVAGWRAAGKALMNYNIPKWSVTKEFITDAATDYLNSSINKLSRHPLWKSVATKLSNKKWLKNQIDADSKNPHYIHETSNDGFVNDKSHSYFTQKGLHPGDRTLNNYPRRGENHDLIWLNKNRRYMDEGENLGIDGDKFISYYTTYPEHTKRDMWTSDQILHRLDTFEPSRTTLVIDENIKTRTTPLNTYSQSAVVTENTIPYSSIKQRIVYDPLTKTFSKFTQNPIIHPKRTVSVTK